MAHQDNDLVKTGGELPQNRSISLVAVGSNRAFRGVDPASLVKAAVQRVAGELGVIRGASGLYRTPAFPPGAGPEFVNAAFSLLTEAAPQAVIEVLHSVELEFGRQRMKRWEARTLDLDLIAHGAQVLPDQKGHQYWRELPLDAQMKTTPDKLVLPHPRLQDRAFVLIPLAEIAPDWIHPILNKSVGEMLSGLPTEVTEQVQPL